MKNKKRLLIFIWGLGIGGVQKRMRDVAMDINMKYKNWELFFLVKYRFPDEYSDYIKKNTNAKFLFFNNVKRNRFNNSSFFWVLKNVWLIRPDVILTFMDNFSTVAVIIKKILFWRKIKVVLDEVILTSRYLKIYRGKSVNFWGTLIKIFYPMADKIIVPSKACQMDLVDNFGIEKNKILVINNWTLFKKRKIETEKIYDAIYVGRLDGEKNIDVLIDLAKKMTLIKPGYKQIILGTGNEEKRLKKKAKQMKIEKNVLFMGYKKNVEYYLEKSKMFILPSINEGMPNVVLEAAAYKLPSVINNFLGAKEVVVDNKTGYICNNEKEMYNKVLYLLENENLRSEMGEKAAVFIEENFSLKNQTKFIKTLLN